MVGVVIQAGTLNLQEMVRVQADGEIFGWGAIGSPFFLTQIVGLGVFLIPARPSSPRPRSTCRSPNRLVTGYITEYTGLRFLLFFIGEFAAVGSLAAIAATLFLGGWYLPASTSMPTT